MTVHQVLIDGQWRQADSTGVFQSEDPATATPIDQDFPISGWADCDAALEAAAIAFDEMRSIGPDQRASFLEEYANRIESNTDEICELASRETALPVQPRLAGGELPRTTNQLRQAAAAAKQQSWCQPTIDTASGIRSCYAAIGPVAIFGPNNFPLAFNGISGGDFAAAIAAGNPVIAKAHPLHPGTTRLLAEQARAAAEATNMPAGLVQLIYHMSVDDGLKLVADDRLAAVGFTGSRKAGLGLKRAADLAGKPIYLELSSINPVVILENGLQQRGDAIAEEFANSCLMGVGQFCTNPGLVVLPKGDASEQFIKQVAKQFRESEPGTLLSKAGQQGLQQAREDLIQAGAELVCGQQVLEGSAYRVANSLLRTTGDHFLKHPSELQTEAFGNASLMVVVDSVDQAAKVLSTLEGNLTGCIYSAQDGSDDSSYDALAPILRQKVGRLLNDKMPTGVAVCPAMNHGGPFPATGHPGFTAVGIPGSIVRFSMLQCFDNVRGHRLPNVLADQNPGNVWRCIDGQWTTDDVPASC